MAGVWTRNYWNMITAQVLCDDTLTSTTQPTDYNPPIMLRNTGGSWFNAPNSNINTSMEAKSVLFNAKNTAKYGYTTSEVTVYDFGVTVGSGTTPATIDDYMLQAPITSGLTLTSSTGTLTQSTAYDSATHHITSKRSFTITNTSASNKTINEIGLFIRPSSQICMIYREVFDEPIVLLPSESLIITFNRDGEVYDYHPY